MKSNKEERRGSSKLYFQKCAPAKSDFGGKMHLFPPNFACDIIISMATAKWSILIGSQTKLLSLAGVSYIIYYSRHLELQVLPLGQSGLHCHNDKIQKDQLQSDGIDPTSPHCFGQTQTQPFTQVPSSLRTNSVNFAHGLSIPRCLDNMLRPITGRPDLDLALCKRKSESG